MTSYMSLFKSAAADIALFYPALAITARQGLRWMSEAVHQMQVETGAVRCSDSFTLIPEGTVGVYPLSKCPEVIFLAEYLSSANAIPQFPAIVDWETFERRRADWYVVNSDITVVQAAPLMVTFNGSNAHIFPYAGITGSIRLDYKPALEPYDAMSPSGDWAFFGTSPENAMKTNSYPVQFRAAEESIKAFCKARMIQCIPNYEKLYPGAYAEEMGLFRDGARRIIRKNPPQDLDVRTPVSMIPGVM